MQFQLSKAIEEEAPGESKTLQDLVEDSIIPQGIDIPEPEEVFGLNGVPIMTKGSLSTVIGKAKSGKTTVTAWMSAQLITKDMTVIWFDTEQGLYYGSRTQYWVLAIAKLKSCPNLIYFDLKVHKPHKRAEIIEEAIKLYRPDLAILDGSRDLVYDINDPKEATEVSGMFMKWAIEYNLHLLTILHVNKGNSEARGHLGTELINKSESIIRVTNNKEEGRVECEPEESRGRGFGSFAFERDDRGIPILIEDYEAITVSNNIKKEPSLMPNDPNLMGAHIEVIGKMFSQTEWMKYSDCISQIRLYFGSHGIKFGDNKAREFLEYYRNEALMIYDENRKGYAKWRSGLIKNNTIAPNEEF